ncbi:MAG: zf-HC2 domain-containing protein [Nitrospirota bacterium]|nr:zf-HC2 domain-containing protein [Nitrospirota bacterium]
MKQKHEDIKEKLPEYFSGALSEEEKTEVKGHLDGCRDCREELELIKVFARVDPPDPGEVFWAGLPRKVISLSKEQKVRFPAFQWFLRPQALAAAVLLIAIPLFIMLYIQNRPGYYYDPLFSDPLSASAVDYSRLTEDDLTEVSAKLIFNGAATDVPGGIFDENSYHEDIASLTPKEVDNFFRELKNEKIGG